MQTLNELYEIAKKYTTITLPDVPIEAAKTFAAIGKIEEESQKRGIEHYSTRLDELVEDIKDEVEFNVVALSVNYPNYKKPMLIVPLIPYLDLLKEKSPELHQKAKRIIDDTFSNREKIIKSQYGKRILAQLKGDTNTQNALYNPMPTGSAINTIISVINAGQDGVKGIEELPKRKAKFSHTKYTVTSGDPLSDDGDKFIIRHDMSKGRGYVSIQLPESLVKNLAGWSVATKKIFALILEKINEQAFSDGVLTRNCVDFSIQELIERGIYSTPQSAVKGIKISANTLTGIKLEGRFTFKKKTVEFSSAYIMAVLFPTIEVKRGQCTIKLNDDVNWSFILQAFSMLPIYYYSLPNRASELCHLIFATARQHTEDIKKRGHFSISFRAIQQALHLPDEDKTTHPKQDIKDVINNAIDDIEKSHREYFGNDEDLLFLSAEYDESWPIARFLNEGYLQVSLSGAFAQPFIDIEEDKIKGLKEAKRRQRKALKAKTAKDKDSELR